LYLAPCDHVLRNRNRNLITSGLGPDLDTDMLWQFMLGVADTLETWKMKK